MVDLFKEMLGSGAAFLGASCGLTLVTEVELVVAIPAVVLTPRRVCLLGTFTKKELSVAGMVLLLRGLILPCLDLILLILPFEEAL